MKSSQIVPIEITKNRKGSSEFKTEADILEQPAEGGAADDVVVVEVTGQNSVKPKMSMREKCSDFVVKFREFRNKKQKVDDAFSCNFYHEISILNLRTEH